MPWKEMRLANPEDIGFLEVTDQLTAEGSLKVETEDKVRAREIFEFMNLNNGIAVLFYEKGNSDHNMDQKRLPRIIQRMIADNSDIRVATRTNRVLGQNEEITGTNLYFYYTKKTKE